MGVAKTNWGSILKTVVNIVLDLLKNPQTSKSSGSGTNRKTSQPVTKPKSTSTSNKRKTSKTVRSADSGAHTTKSTKTSARTTSSSRTTPATTVNGSKPKKSQSSTSKQGAGTTDSSRQLSDEYPGDFSGKVTAQYAPELDGDPDPGEIVWTWVPYEEDYTQGKDRPVLLIGHDGPWLLGLMLTSKDKDGSRYGQWLDIGSGPWDSQGRDSEIRLDRIIRINPQSMRREGAVMDEDTFRFVVDSM